MVLGTAWINQNVTGGNIPVWCDTTGHRDTLFMRLHLYCQYLNGQNTMQFQLNHYKGDTNVAWGYKYSNDGINFSPAVLIDSMTRDSFYYYDLGPLKFQDWEYILFFVVPRDTTADSIWFKVWLHFGQNGSYH
jgi:hypothetical protein